MDKKTIQNQIDLQRTSLWVGATVLIIDSICLILLGTFEFVIALGMFIGIMSISTSLWQYIGMEKPLKDERSARTGAKAGLYSWYITLVTAAIGAAVLGYLPEAWNIHPTAAQALGGIILVAMTTMIGIYEYMNWKGTEE